MWIFLFNKYNSATCLRLIESTADAEPQMWKAECGLTLGFLTTQGVSIPNNCIVQGSTVYTYTHTHTYMRALYPNFPLVRMAFMVFFVVIFQLFYKEYILK